MRPWDLAGIAAGEPIKRRKRSRLHVGRFTAFDLFNADEVFICNTSGAALPVREVSGRKVLGALPGPITTRLHDAYWRIRAEGWHCTPVHDR